MSPTPFLLWFVGGDSPALARSGRWWRPLGWDGGTGPLRGAG